MTRRFANGIRPAFVGGALLFAGVVSCKATDGNVKRPPLSIHAVKLPEKPIAPRPTPPGIPARYEDEKAFSVWGLLKRRFEAEKGGFVARVKGYVVEAPRCVSGMKRCDRYHLVLADRETPYPGDARVVIADIPSSEAATPLLGARIIVEGEFRLQSKDYFAAPDGLISFRKLSSLTNN
ncbi:MAG: hypothetical protein HYY84_05580 [Deltaproteobacteria bacterium]|nr:hypothetical protein [Deltaproteobacteria bacterium]